MSYQLTFDLKVACKLNHKSTIILYNIKTFLEKSLNF